MLRVVAKKHAFGCGLVTGGRKDVEGEQARVVNMNILVATPGRLLQHFEETSGLDAAQLMVLVLDEADRILDLGKSAQLSIYPSPAQCCCEQASRSSWTISSRTFPRSGRRCCSRPRRRSPSRTSPGETDP